MKDKKKQSKEYTKPIVISVGLHALLVAALLWGTDFAMTKPEPTGQMVQAVVIDPKLVQQQAKEIRQQREKAAKKEQDRLDKLRREAAQKAEQERIAKEKAAKEAAEKARKEKERLKRLELERKEQEAALDDIFAGLESEASANQQAQGKFVADEVSRYSSIYIQLIQSRLLKDDYLLGKECRVNIKLIPTGTDMIVSSVNVLSGDSRVCAAAKSAIAQVPSFPMSTDSTVNQRLKDINLTVALQQ
ncbi:TPA: cell envelope integrity protein TolA [Vibrio parahaemolyticus]|nr:cell envelope integrity protein TolA [Vibrio parahaemolyticus]